MWHSRGRARPEVRHGQDDRRHAVSACRSSGCFGVKGSGGRGVWHIESAAGAGSGAWPARWPSTIAAGAIERREEGFQTGT